MSDRDKTPDKHTLKRNLDDALEQLGIRGKLITRAWLIKKIQ